MRRKTFVLWRERVRGEFFGRWGRDGVSLRSISPRSTSADGRELSDRDSEEYPESFGRDYLQE